MKKKGTQIPRVGVVVIFALIVIGSALYLLTRGTDLANIALNSNDFLNEHAKAYEVYLDTAEEVSSEFYYEPLPSVWESWDLSRDMVALGWLALQRA